MSTPDGFLWLFLVAQLTAVALSLLWVASAVCFVASRVAPERLRRLHVFAATEMLVLGHLSAVGAIGATLATRRFAAAAVISASMLIAWVMALKYKKRHL